MTPLDWVIGIASGMAILASMSGAFWFVMRSSLEPTRIVVDMLAKSLDALGKRIEDHDKSDDAKFATLHDKLSTLREDTGSHRRSP